MTLASMTGFGRARGELSERLTASVVVRSVNHKFLDVGVRTNIRDEIPELETAVRTAITDSLQRGRVTAQVDFERTAVQPARVVVNAEVVASLVGQLADLELPAAMAGGFGLGDVLTIPGVVAIESVATRPEPDEVAALGALTEEAVAALVAMRQSEATALSDQIRVDLGEIETFLDWFEPRTVEFKTAILDRLRNRLEELLGPGGVVDDERLIQEAAILADRADVGEETVRLRTHLTGFRERLDGGDSVGRALDFMCQEILRELNTLGSKCRELGVADRLVDAKTSLERVREQIQNLE
jgi:uncharacterized protein (TIGR00255 family)